MNMRMKKKSQLSMEFLVVLAASASFLIALLPVYMQAQEKTREAIADAIQSTTFEKIVALAKQSHVLGKGSFLKTKVRIAAETLFSFDEETGIATMNYSNNAKTKGLSEKIAFAMEMQDAWLQKGIFEVAAENDGKVKIFFSSNSTFESDRES